MKGTFLNKNAQAIEMQDGQNLNSREGNNGTRANFENSVISSSGYQNFNSNINANKNSVQKKGVEDTLDFPDSMKIHPVHGLS